MRPLERIDPGNSQRSFVSVFDTFESQKDVCIHGLLLSNVRWFCQHRYVTCSFNLYEPGKTSSQ